MSENTPEMVLIPKSELVKQILDATSQGAAVEREAIRERLLAIRELTTPGSDASIELTKWVRQLG